MTETTEIRFDLAKVLTAHELESFAEKAKQANAKNLTEYFLEVVLKREQQNKPAA